MEVGHLRRAPDRSTTVRTAVTNVQWSIPLRRRLRHMAAFGREQPPRRDCPNGDKGELLVARDVPAFVPSRVYLSHR